MLDSGNWCNDDNILRRMAVRFFNQLYSQEDTLAPLYNYIGLFPSLSDE